MVFEFWLIGAFLGIVVVMFIVAMIVKGFHYAIALAINSIIGFFALYALKAFEVVPTLVINIWSVIIVAIFGLLGMIAVLILHGLGLFF